MALMRMLMVEKGQSTVDRQTDGRTGEGGVGVEPERQSQAKSSEQLTLLVSRDIANSQLLDCCTVTRTQLMEYKQLCL